MKYNAFISYSHFLDHKLAPSIQAGLQRLGKPWHKIRQLNVFRDETDLTAAPSLWQKIVEAMDSSDYFILLASPEAAASIWVNREIAYWLSKKDSSKIIIAVSSGVFKWQETGVDWEHTTAISPVFREQLTSEPFYVDFSQLRTNNDLSLNNPEFKSTVAKISAAIQGIPLRDLISKDVEEQRKTIRLRNTVISTILVFLVALIITSIVIFNQRNAARRSAAANDHVVKALNKESVSQSLFHMYQAYQYSSLPYISNLMLSFQARLVTFYNWIDIKDKKDTLFPKSMVVVNDHFIVSYSEGIVRNYDQAGKKVAERKFPFQDAESFIRIPGSDNILTWGYDTSIRADKIYVFSAASLQPVNQIIFSALVSINAASITPEAAVLLSCSDGMVRVLAKNGMLTDSLQLAPHGIMQAFVDRDGNYIALIREEHQSGLLKRFSKTGKELGSYSSTQGDRFAAIDYRDSLHMLAGADIHGGCFTWDNVGMANHEFNAEKEGVEYVFETHSVDHCVISPAGDCFAVITEDKCILLDTNAKLMGVAATWGRLDNVIFSDSPGLFYSMGAGDAKIICWDYRGFLLDYKTYPEKTELIKSRQGDMYAIIATDSIHVFDVFNNRRIIAVKKLCDTLKYFDNYNDDLLVFGGDSSMQVVRKDKGNYSLKFVRLSGGISIAFLDIDHFNNKVYYSSGKGTVSWYDLINGKEETKPIAIKGAIDFVYSLSPAELLIGGGKLDDSSFFGLYDISLNLKKKLEGHTAEVTDAKLTRDGKNIISVDDAGRMILWDKSSGEKKFNIDGGVGVSMNVDVSADGKFFITNGMFGNEVCIIDRNGNKIQSQLFSREPIFVRFTADGNFVVIARNSIYKLLSLDNFMQSGRIVNAKQVEKLEAGTGLFSFNAKALIRN